MNLSHQEELNSILTHSVQHLYAHYGDVGVTELFIRYSLMDPQDPKAKVTLTSILSNPSSKLYFSVRIIQ